MDSDLKLFVVVMEIAAKLLTLAVMFWTIYNKSRCTKALLREEWALIGHLGSVLLFEMWISILDERVLKLLSNPRCVTAMLLPFVAYGLTYGTGKLMSKLKHKTAWAEQDVYHDIYGKGVPDREPFSWSMCHWSSSLAVGLVPSWMGYLSGVVMTFAVIPSAVSFMTLM